MFDCCEMLSKIGKIYEKNTGSVRRCIESDEERETILNNVFGDNWEKKHEIKSMYVDDKDDAKTINYVTGDSNTSHVVYVKNGYPLFSIVYSSKSVVGKKDKITTTYVETTYTIYQDNSNEIENMINTKSKNREELNKTTLEVDIMNVYTGENNYVSTHNYKIHIKNGMVIDFVNNKYPEEKWERDHDSFYSRLDIIEKNINKVNDKIENKIDSILGNDNVKEYTINRKTGK